VNLLPMSPAHLLPLTPVRTPRRGEGRTSLRFSLREPATRRIERGPGVRVTNRDLLAG
jgi:hypothetical protein